MRGVWSVRPETEPLLLRAMAEHRNVHPHVGRHSDVWPRCNGGERVSLVMRVSGTRKVETGPLPLRAMAEHRNVHPHVGRHSDVWPRCNGGERVSLVMRVSGTRKVETGPLPLRAMAEHRNVHPHVGRHSDVWPRCNGGGEGEACDEGHLDREGPRVDRCRSGRWPNIGMFTHMWADILMSGHGATEGEGESCDEGCLEREPRD